MPEIYTSCLVEGGNRGRKQYSSLAFNARAELSNGQCGTINFQLSIFVRLAPFFINSRVKKEN